MPELLTEFEQAIHTPLPPSVSSLNISEVEVSPAEDEFELQDLSLIEFRTTSSIESLPQRNVSELAPTDGGYKAWSFLAASFVVEAVVWAFPTSFGVLLSAYLHDAKLASQSKASEILPLVGTFSSGIMYCSGSTFIYPFLHRYPKQRRTCVYAGLLLCFASLFGASYATKVRDLLILQGLLYAIGGSLLYAPCISYMSEWFVRKRGLANGIMFAGTAVGGLFLPLIMPLLVNSYGPSKTLRILSVAVLVLILPGTPFLRPRLPETRVYGPGSRSEAGDEGFRKWMLNPSFMLCVLANMLQGFAYFLPILWLPTFASELRLSDTQSSVAVALLNGASVLSRVGMGTLADSVNPWVIALITTFLTSFATFVLWGILSSSFAGVLAFGITYGALAGGWSSLFTGFIQPIAKENPALTTTLFGVFLLTRGIGNILSTPISTALSDISAMSAATGESVGNGRYAKMIVYVGTCFAGAGVIAVFGLGVDVYGRRRSARMR
ncbi:MFS general substrate transporter [Fomitiporia mediterranea MF3/22]|uniref:MFS general substrate transporter n=1 Tax=Fomitiporia mediterranea (strain MF3/22) TaxID=694068 RepID=UPI0004407A0E|nr:MFS general substrate transporter [Fomitiporia mediterranea MF3/22]EJC98140.1 MFS general substrate transporter [Fomitiporia mediterranea MF3/22]